MSMFQAQMMQTEDERMVDRPEAKTGSYTDSVLVKMRNTGSMDQIETCMVPILSDPIRKSIEGRASSRVNRLRQHFLMYIDRTCRLSGEQVCQELLMVNKYLQSHVLYFDRSTNRTSDTPAIMYMYHADVPQILLELLHQAYFDPDYFNGPVEGHLVPYYAIEMLTCFLHPSSATFLLLPDKLFTDSLSRLDSLADIACGKALNWFNRFAISHFFGTASFTPQGKYWLYTHLGTFQELCSTMAKCGSFIKAQIKRGDVYSNNKVVITQLKHFRDLGGLKQTARIFGHFVTGQCIYVFLHVLQYSHLDYDKFCTVSQAVKRANVLGNFHLVIKQVMSWTDPAHFLNPYLNGISLCLEMENGFEDLLINDIINCQKEGVPLGIQSLEYWNQNKGKKTFPCRLAWFLLHALCRDNRLGAGWCVYMICWCLSRGPEEVWSQIVGACGDELMDLAHLLICDYPTHTRVQGVVLEVLLRYGGVSHHDNTGDVYEGSCTLKDPQQLKGFSLEAAVFCKKTQCEEKMNIHVKQRRVIESDRLKEDGNNHFKAGRYKEAVQSYTEAIAVCPLSARTKQAVYYSNRAECYLRMSEYWKTVHDCNRALCLDKSLKVKVQWRRAKAYQNLKLDYAVWLDMRCIQVEWRMNKEEGQEEFEKQQEALDDKLGVSKENMRSELFHHFWFTWLLTVD